MNSPQTIHQKKGRLPMKSITQKEAKSQAQKARQREHVVKLAQRKGKKYACAVYGEPLSNVKRWCRKYDSAIGWKSLRDKSHRPLSPHPEQHTPEEESLIRKAFKEKFFRYGWIEVYNYLLDELGYTRTFSGMRYAAKRMGLAGETLKKKPSRKHDRKFPEKLKPGESVQIDVKFVPYNCLKGAAKRDEKRLYQWTAIDECTRLRFVYGYDEHTPENSCDFFRRLQAAFPFPIQCVQTDNGTEFTYRFLEGEKLCPFEEMLGTLGIAHKLIPPRTPWHNGKVERSHRTDQRYFYDWEKFGSVEEFNEKLAIHLAWYNNRRMAVLGFISPIQRLNALLPA
jgi:transposase InsO family protein